MSGHESVRPDDPSARTDGDVLRDIAALMQHVHVPCWILDSDGVFTWINDAFLSIFGDQRGKYLSAIIAPESLERAERHHGLINDENPVSELEIVMVRADGSRVRTEISSVLLSGIGLCCGAFGLAGLTGKPARGQADNADLTPRQTDVLMLLADGASTEQIANELYLSTTTVRNHISGILQALDVHSRLAAVTKARREGLVED